MPRWIPRLAVALRFRAAALILLFPAAFALANVDSISSLFAAASWLEARAVAAPGVPAARPGEAALWRSRLATNPLEAADILREGLSEKRVSDRVRIRMALELADLEAGMGHPVEVITLMAPFVDDGGDDLPGALYLRTARALQSVGRQQRARELLAGIRPSDAAFAESRVELGRIALAQNDAELALRYFDAADAASPTARTSSAAGRWQALRMAGRPSDADRLQERLAASHPGCLALLEIRRQERDEKPVGSAPLQTLPVPAAQPETPVAEPAAEGRYTLQLGAFADRGRALEFQKRYRDRVPDLRIDEGTDAKGQILYRLRTGAFFSPDVGAAEAEILSERLELDVIVVAKDPTERRGH